MPTLYLFLYYIDTYKANQIKRKIYDNKGKLEYEQGFPYMEEINLAEKLNPKEMVTPEELIYSNMMKRETISRLLVKKGIITKDELQTEFTQHKHSPEWKLFLLC